MECLLSATRRMEGDKKLAGDDRDTRGDEYLALMAIGLHVRQNQVNGYEAGGSEGLLGGGQKRALLTVQRKCKTRNVVAQSGRQRAGSFRARSEQRLSGSYTNGTRFRFAGNRNNYEGGNSLVIVCTQYSKSFGMRGAAEALLKEEESRLNKEHSRKTKKKKRTQKKTIK